MRILFALLAFTALFAAGCGNSSTSTDCDYQIHRVKAEVVGIERLKEGAEKDHFNVTMAFSGSSLGDNPQNLGELLEMPIDTLFMETNRIYVGNKYFADVSERIAGNCEPLIVSFDHHFRSGREK